MKRSSGVISSLLLLGCNATSNSPPFAQLPADCTSPGKIVPGELSQPSGGYAYSYRVYLPPCFSNESDFHYPVLYIIPGLGGGPDGWFAVGLAKIADD